MRRITCSLCGLVCLVLASPAIAADKPDVLQIGSSGSLTKEQDKGSVESANNALKKLILDETGLKSDLIVTGSLEKLEADIKSGKLHLGLFQGYEFAWAREKNPNLKSLAIGVNQYPKLVTSVVAKRDSQATELAAFKGKVLAMPVVSLEHGKLFINKATDGKKPEEFFGKVTAPQSVEDALDDVVDGVAQVTLADQVALDAFKRRKPGRFGKLKEIQKAEFPVPVVVYQEGVLDKEILQRFRDGILRAKKTAEGRRVLELWRLTAFEPVPAQYETELAALLKTYPPPK
jgi:ABC-type phosphate/phosphonate transport system substrate-binding protein